MVTLPLGLILGIVIGWIVVLVWCWKLNTKNEALRAKVGVLTSSVDDVIDGSIRYFLVSKKASLTHSPTYRYLRDPVYDDSGRVTRWHYAVSLKNREISLDSGVVFSVSYDTEADEVIVYTSPTADFPGSEVEHSLRKEGLAGILYNIEQKLGVATRQL